MNNVQTCDSRFRDNHASTQANSNRSGWSSSSDSIPCTSSSVVSDPASTNIDEVFDFSQSSRRLVQMDSFGGMQIDFDAQEKAIDQLSRLAQEDDARSSQYSHILIGTILTLSDPLKQDQSTHTLVLCMREPQLTLSVSLTFPVKSSEQLQTL